MRARGRTHHPALCGDALACGDFFWGALVFALCRSAHIVAQFLHVFCQRIPASGRGNAFGAKRRIGSVCRFLKRLFGKTPVALKTLLQGEVIDRLTHGPLHQHLIPPVARAAATPSLTNVWKPIPFGFPRHSFAAFRPSVHGTFARMDKPATTAGSRWLTRFTPSLANVSAD